MHSCIYIRVLGITIKTLLQNAGMNLNVYMKLDFEILSTVVIN